MPPGKEGKVELAVEHTEGYVGEVSKVAGVSTNDPKNPNFNLVLRARFKTDSPAAPPVAAPLNPNPVFTVEPGEKWTTSALVGASSSNSFYLYNPQAKPIHVKTVVPGGNDFTAAIETLQEGKRYQLTITSNPALKPGHYVQTLKALTDSTVQPVISIELDLTVYPKVFASPTSIIMPTLTVASDLAAINWPMIYVRRLREPGLKIKSYTSTLPFLKLELLTETENQVYKIRLTVDSSKIKPGEFKGKIRIETNDPDVPFVEVPVQVAFK
ncbi:MAG: hypothetical protein DMF60_06630 [Acidobacteria bacterium]|nr:MAG: hypothetical protein DMF60_06630 [Acidobacteriota bacterium]